MTIHGLRIYHRDFVRLFRPVVPAWRGHVLAQDFGVSIGEHGVKDPVPGLRERYGSGLLAVDVPSQLVHLSADELGRWGASVRDPEGALLPVFREPPSFELLKRLYWGRDFRLTSATWPEGMRALLHMWDGTYWQLFTTERSDIDALIRAHGGDTKLAMYFVDLDQEYPNPSNAKLQRAAPPDAAGGACPAATVGRQTRANI